MSSTSYMFEAILLASSLVVLLAWVGIRLTTRIGLYDMPNSAPHKLHTAPMPLAGGIALIGALILSAILFGVYRDPNVIATFWSGLLVFLFGVWDDARGISPALKLAGQVLAAVVVICLGVSVGIFESPEFFLNTDTRLDLYLDWILTILWVVGITNAFNFVDSMDGLAVGLGGMAAAFFMLVTLDAGQSFLSRYSALILGTCIGLYVFNAPPAKLFLGDSGAQTLGFILAVLAIAYTPRGANQSSSWFVPIMLLGVPIFDAVLVVLSRLRRRKPVYAASRDHTYHRLLEFGWSSNRAVLAMQIAALVLGCLAFLALTRSPWIANSIFGASLFAAVLGVVLLDSRRRWP